MFVYQAEESAEDYGVKGTKLGYTELTKARTIDANGISVSIMNVFLGGAKEKLEQEKRNVFANAENMYKQALNNRISEIYRSTKGKPMAREMELEMITPKIQLNMYKAALQAALKQSQHPQLALAAAVLKGEKSKVAAFIIDPEKIKPHLGTVRS